MCVCVCSGLFCGSMHTSKVPAFSRETWSVCDRVLNPGMCLANSTTSRTAGLKEREKSSQISWELLEGSALGHMFIGHAWTEGWRDIDRAMESETWLVYISLGK